MFTTLLSFALFQAAHALAIAAAQDTTPLSTSNSPTHHLSKRVTTGVKVAVGICVPAAALAVGLGVVILAMYPAQLRKLRAQNGGADVTLADVMNGKVVQRPAPPPYHEANRDSTTTAGDEARGEPPSYPVQPKADTTTTATTNRTMPGDAARQAV